MFVVDVPAFPKKPLVLSRGFTHVEQLTADMTAKVTGNNPHRPTKIDQKGTLNKEASRSSQIDNPAIA